MTAADGSGHAADVCVEVRVYAELVDLAPGDGRGRHAVPTTGRRGVKDVIEAIGVPHTEVDLILVDGVSVPFDTTVQPGQRVAVYPVFEAFDISAVTQVRPTPLREPRFLLDVHLGTLARHLRLLGFDAEADEEDDATLAARSVGEHRILLTRDRGLLKRGVVTHGYCVRSDDPEVQAAEVLRRFDLAGLVRPFVRCRRCNGRLAPVAKAAVLPELPPRTQMEHDRFSRCERCGGVYWPGSHLDRLERLIRDILRMAAGDQ